MYRNGITTVAPMRPPRITPALLTAVAVGACSGPTGSMTVTDAWAPPTPPSIDVAAIYVSIENATGNDDRIISATTDRCGRIELHATQIDDDNIMMMRPAGPSLLTVDSDDTIEMAPGGLHMMCLDMPRPLSAGETIDVTVMFESGATLQTAVPVEQR